MEMWQTTASGIFRKSISIFLLWRRRASTRRTLRYLDPGLLTDVGLSARDREQECAKWFWQGHRRAWPGRSVGSTYPQNVWGENQSTSICGKQSRPVPMAQRCQCGYLPSNGPTSSIRIAQATKFGRGQSRLRDRRDDLWAYCKAPRRLVTPPQSPEITV